jgi:hypothetical protein
MEQPRNAKPKARLLRWLTIGAVIIVSLIAVAVILLVIRWPFSRHRTTASLEQTLHSTVEMERFDATYFPHPGCVIRRLKVTQWNSSGQMNLLVTADTMIVRAAYLDFFSRPGYIRQIVLEGLKVQIPPREPPRSEKTSGQNSPQPPTDGRPSYQGSDQSGHGMRVGEIVANDATLVVARADGKKPLEFQIHSLAFAPVAANEPMGYTLAMTNALPPGELKAHGRLGPWNTRDPAKTHLSGTSVLEDADLGVFPGVTGELSSRNEFEGTFDNVDVDGVVDVPHFKVRSAGSSVPLHAPFNAKVKALKGDVDLQRVELSLQRTLVEVRGQIMGQPGRPGKITAVTFAAQNGRIQDVLQLFAETKPPLNGATNFRARAVVRAWGRQFLRQTQLQAQFEITDARFTNPHTQASIDDLSRRAQRHKGNGPAPDVTSELHGHVALSNAVAQLTDLSVTVAAAIAHMDGTYDLLNDKIDFHGTLRTDAEIAKTTRGIKSVLLTPLDPFFKKGSAGAVIPVEMTGTYHNPHFGLDLAAQNKAQKNKRQK